MVGWVSGVSQIRQAANKSVVASSSPMWAGWEPGNPGAARKLLGDGTGVPGLKALLDNANVVITGVRQTRINDLSRILGNVQKLGLGYKQAARMIREEFTKSRVWSEMVARTEGRRAVTAASLDSYAAAEIDQVQWITAWGEACDICKEYEGMSPVPRGAGFDGLDGPPGHPNCLCVVGPFIEGVTELEGWGARNDPAPSPDDFLEDAPAAAPIELPDTHDDHIVTGPDDVGVAPVVALEDRLPTITKLSPDEFDSRLDDMKREEIKGRREPGNSVGYAVQKVTGYDALPGIASRAEMDELIASGWQETFRGVASDKAPEMFEQFKTGTFFPGNGIYGNGTYSAEDFFTAETYANGPDAVSNGNGIVWRMAISPNAAVVDVNDLLDEYDDYRRANPNYGNDEMLRTIIDDAGYFAMRQGYDVITVGSRGYNVILNRGAVMVQSEAGR